MTSGLGISIGTVNVVSARVGAQDSRPAVRTRRTAVGFDSGGTARLGGITRFSTAVSEFADLGRNPESVYVDGRIWSPATIFASVVQGLVAAEPATGVVATYPAGYSRKHLELLHQSLDLAGVGHVQLVPEPVAAAHWLDTEQGPLDTGFVLVYDLGGNSLDVSVVRTGPDWPDHPVVGKPVRSYEFGGRPLGALIARCAGDRAIGPAEPGTGAVSLMSFVNPEGLRREHVRDSLEVVRSAVRSAGVSLSDIAQVLVVGGAARPPQVAGTLAELGLPVTIAADSGQCVALGAAAMAAESVAGTGSPRVGHPPIFSGAALFSAVAMSAATILGNSPADTGPLDQDRIPLQSPGAVRYEIHGEARVERSGTGWTVSYAPLDPSALVAPAATSRPYGPAMPGAESADRTDRLRTDRPAGAGSGTHNSARDGHELPAARRDDPARFDHPLPSERSGTGTPGRDRDEGSGSAPGPGDPPGTEPEGPQDAGSGPGPGGGSPEDGGPAGGGIPQIPGPGSWSDGGHWSGGGWSGDQGGWSGPGTGDTGSESENGAGSESGDGAGPGAVDQGGSPGGGDGDSGSGGGDSTSGGSSSSGGSDSSSGHGGDSGHSGGDSGGDSSGGSTSGGTDSTGGSSVGGADSSGGDSSGGGDSSHGGSSSGGDSSGGSKSGARGSDSGGSRSGGGDGGSSKGGSRN
ncbi:Hsp70 family protein [Nocardia sp. NPDC024068]|uniref:Hsp70 family protein n=1 Tax=Nocardia sp. NPDC024068 TaxID=3157197 RepID=UPI0033C2CED9